MATNGNVVTLHNTAERKAALVHQALDALKLASEIDESESYVVDWVTWYDEILADCTDLEMIAGAMRVELASRRGQLIIAEGEKRGGDGSNQYESKSKALTNFSSAEKVQRSNDRIIASEPEAVKAYVQQACKPDVTGVPSIRGAVKAAKAAQAQRHGMISYQDQPVGGAVEAAKTARAEDPAEDDDEPEDQPAIINSPKPHGVIPRASTKRHEFMAALEKLADGQPHTLFRTSGHRKVAGDLPSDLLSITAIDWLSPFYQVTIARDSITITPVKDLREVFDDFRARKNAPEFTGVGALARHLWNGIQQREEAFLASRRTTNWTTDRQLSTAYERWLDWLKAELARVLGE